MSASRPLSPTPPDFEAQPRTLGSDPADFSASNASKSTVPKAGLSDEAEKREAHSQVDNGADQSSNAAPISESAELIAAKDSEAAPSLIERILATRTVPSVLVSFIFHTLILIVLAVCTLHARGRGGNIFDASPTAESGDDGESDPIAIVQLPSGSREPSDSESAAAESAMNTALSQPSIQPLAGSAFEQALEPVRAETTESKVATLMEATTGGTVATLGHANVDGRAPGARRQLAIDRGGNADSEAAVERALEWLAAHQRPNGSWSLVHTTDKCNGACTHEGSKDRYDTAATGLALLAFLGAGYTHRDGAYKDQVRRGVYYLIQVIDEKSAPGGNFLDSSPQGMYNHGIAAFALCEAYQLSKDESLKGISQKAIDFIVYAQNSAGGWGYLPKQPGDLTLTGWQVMALKSANSAGLYVPTSTILRVDHFLDTQTDSDKSFYGYRTPSKQATCTAIGLLLRMFRGWQTTDPRVLKGVAFLQSEGVSRTDMYRNYYVTLIMFHEGGRLFDGWNKPMRDYLVQTQDRTGHAAGSWYFEDKFGETGGRLYTTAMCAMILEVYYRFSPLYMNSERPFEF